MRIHLIAIGGSAMHNIALALQQNGHEVSGSDDEIYDPARSRLQAAGLYPSVLGWHPENIENSLDAVILGMHARADNPELKKALELGIKVYSYPEFVYAFSKSKKRIVIGGSHGKTSTTSMIMHVLKHMNKDFDYLVGAQIPGFDTMVRFSEADIMIIEGDEYLSSCLDRRPKFLHYRPHLAVLTGISWDHINVFPEYKDYREQFQLFVDSLENEARLFFYKGDAELQTICAAARKDIDVHAYDVFPGTEERFYASVMHDDQEYKMRIFGKHNMENMHAAYCICRELGVSMDSFLEAMQDFEGAARRLQQFIREENCAVIFDFAHAPSKVKASIQAVKLQFAHLRVRAVFELHTFSSLNKTFLKEYEFSMREADEAIVFFDSHTLEMKQMSALSHSYVSKAFNHPNIKVFTSSEDLAAYLEEATWKGYCNVFMSSGNFRGLPLKELASAKVQV